MTFMAKVIVYIKGLASQYFPVALLKRYISMCNIEFSSSVALTSYMQLNYHIPNVGRSLKSALRK